MNENKVKITPAKVVDIWWERTRVNFVFEIKSSFLADENKNSFSKHELDNFMGGSLALRHKKKKNFLKLNPLRIERVSKQSAIRVEVLLSNAYNGQFLANGSYEVGILDSSNEWLAAIVSKDLAYKIRKLDKIFRYDFGASAWTVNFYLTFNEKLAKYQKKDFIDNNLDIEAYTQNGEVLPNLTIQAYFMSENSKWAEPRFSRKEKVMGFAYKLLHKFYNTFNNKKCSKNILIMSESAVSSWGNIAHIQNKIKTDYSKYNLITSFRMSNKGGQSFINWIKVINKVAKSRIIIIDDYAPIFKFLKPYKDTKLVQIWHAGLGFKISAYSRFGIYRSPHPAISCHRLYTTMIAPSQSTIPLYNEMFPIAQENIKPFGVARMDSFLAPNAKQQAQEKVYGAFPQLKGKKVILFAPTYRGKSQKGSYYDFNKLDLEKINEFIKNSNNEFIFAIKMHHFIEKVPDFSKYSPNIIDVSHYQELNDFLHISNILITDYSSAYFEWSALKKPLIFFVYDKMEYEIFRGVHSLLDDFAPGKIIKTTQEFIDAIKASDFEIEKTIDFANKTFGNLDNESGSQVTKKILESILEND